MRHEELFYVLALKQIMGIRNAAARELIQRFGSARKLFHASASEWTDAGLCAEDKSRIDYKSIEAEIRFVTARQISFFFLSDDDYPPLLKHCPDAPLLLFGSGNISFGKRRTLSVVGTRNMTPYGLLNTRELIAGVSPYAPVIVSGFAYGVDIAAHESALLYALPTVAVLAHGFGTIYPKAHRKFVEPMKQNGGFLTEFTSAVPPLRPHFLSRNRIVAGISEATVIVESADKGGSLVTASIANDYDREVFAIPGRTSDVFSEGCNRLIRTQRAHLLSKPEDLIGMLQWQSVKPKPVQQRLVLSDDPVEQRIIEFLSKNGCSDIDVLSRGCELSPALLAPALLQMEFKSAVKSLPGKRFSLV